MKKQLLLVLLYSLLSSIIYSQERITEIVKAQNVNRILVKEVGEKKLLLSVTPNNDLIVYELQDDILNEVDRRKYPGIYNSISFYISDNFFLTDNGNASVAYDLRDYTEYEVPYPPNTNGTQWYPRHRDFVKLIQTGSEYKYRYVDLDSEMIRESSNEETLRYQSDQYSRWRYVNEDDTELHIITNLNTGDSIHIHTDRLYAGYSFMSEDAFVYFDDGQIFRLDNNTLTTSKIADLEDTQRIENIRIIDGYVLVQTRVLSTSEYPISIYDSSNDLIQNLTVDWDIRYFHNHLVDGNFLISGKIYDLTYLNINTGALEEKDFQYPGVLHEIGQDYLYTYSQDRIRLISKIDGSIKSSYQPLSGSVSNFTSVSFDDIHYFSLDTREEGDNTLFILSDDDIYKSELFNDETAGISSQAELLAPDKLENVILLEDDLYSINAEGYELLSDSHVDRLDLYNGVKYDNEKVCWPEVYNNIPNSQVRVKCTTQEEEILSLGLLPNTSASNYTNQFMDFAVHNKDIIYLKRSVNGSNSTTDLRIKHHESQVDTLLISYDRNTPFVSTNSTSYFNVNDSLHTYSFESNKLINLDIPISNFDRLRYDEFNVLNGKTYYVKESKIYEINNLESNVILDVPFGSLYHPVIYGEYLSIKDQDGMYFYDGTEFQHLDLGEFESVKYLGYNYALITNHPYYATPPYIYNLETQLSYPLSDDYILNQVDYITKIDDSLALVSQRRSETDIYFYIDQFDSEFNSSINLYSQEVSSNTFAQSKLIENEELNVLILENKILFISAETGNILDQISVSNIKDVDQITCKNDVLYFLRYHDQLKKQVYKYSPNLTSTLEASTIQFNIMPNPTSESITIETKQAMDNIKIYDSGGILKMDRRNNSKNTSIDLSHLATGMYFIEVRAGGEISTQKLMKL